MYNITEEGTGFLIPLSVDANPQPDMFKLFYCFRILVFTMSTLIPRPLILQVSQEIKLGSTQYTLPITSVEHFIISHWM